MKKILLSLAALLMTSVSFAQTTLKVERNTNGTAPAAVKKAAPRKALSANQRLIGTYTSDALAANGLGIPNFPGNNKAAITLDKDMLAPYVGKKIVGIRYGIMVDDVVSDVFVGEITSNGDWTTTSTADNVSNIKAGWNTTTFTTPYTIKANTDIYAGYTYKQKNTSSSGRYTNDCYPLSCVKEGMDAQTLYMYANVPASSGGSGEGWYNFGNTNGNLSIQLIVEGDYQGYYLIPFDFGTIQTAAGKERTVNVKCQSTGAAAVNSISYTYTQNNVTSEEKTVTLSTPEAGTIANFPFTISGADKTGTYDISLKITKVNGEANLAAINTAAGKNLVKAKDLKPTVVMEEFTGTGCGFCPRGIVGMKNCNEKFGDQFIGIAIHQYNQADPMYTVNYAGLSWSGAPACKLNRGTQVDPFYGSSTTITADAESLLEENAIADAAVTVKGEWDATDDTKLNATATIESQTAKTYQVVYVLTGDNVTNTNTAASDYSSWGQSNYFSKAHGAYTYAQLDDDLKFLWEEPYSYHPVFNDVLIASSYSRTINKGANVDAPAEGTAEGTFQLSMPVTNKVLMPYIDRDQLYVVAFLIDPTTKKIVAGGKSKVATWTSGIKGVKNDASVNATEVARYTVDGRMVSAPVKGINIIKMSDGTTKKVTVE